MGQDSLGVIRDMHFNVGLLLTVVVKVAIAWVLSLPLSVERARDDRSAGLRTFPIVALASCAYVIVAQEVLGASNQQGPVLQGLLTGIGFIGGGAIVKEQNRVRGTATAAAILATGIMGAAVGYGRMEIALVTCVFTALPLYFFSRYESAHPAEFSSDALSDSPGGAASSTAPTGPPAPGVR
jgi:putative Mg2+ transporter-C (MgtC) family protein